MWPSLRRPQTPPMMVPQLGKSHGGIAQLAVRGDGGETRSTLASKASASTPMMRQWSTNAPDAKSEHHGQTIATIMSRVSADMQRPRPGGQGPAAGGIHGLPPCRRPRSQRQVCPAPDRKGSLGQAMRLLRQPQSSSCPQDQCQDRQVTRSPCRRRQHRQTARPGPLEGRTKGRGTPGRLKRQRHRPTAAQIGLAST